MKQRGSILMVSLWVAAILAVFALSLGARAIFNLKLARWQKDSLAADLLAQAGLQQAISILNRHSADDYNDLSQLWSTGIDPDTRSYLLKDVELKKDSGNKFTVGFFDADNNYRCMSDEESRLDLNAASLECLTQLFAKLGIETDANKLVNYILYWRNDPSIDPATTYPDLKRERFSNCEELIVVLEYFYKDRLVDYAAKAREVYSQLKDLITVYTAEALPALNLSLNVNTVSPQVLGIVTSSLAANSDEAAAAASLNEKIIALRTARPIKSEEDIINSQLNPGENNFFNKLKPNIVYKSNYFRMQATGNSAKVISKISAVYDRQNKRFVFWQQL